MLNRPAIAIVLALGLSMSSPLPAAEPPAGYEGRPVVDLLALSDSLLNVLQYDSSLSVSQKAYRLAAAVHGEDDSTVARALMHIARADVGLCRYMDAESAYGEALRTWNKLFGDSSIPSAQTIGWLGDARWQGGNYTEGRRLLDRSIGLIEDSLGADSPALIPFLHSRARLLSVLQNRTGVTTSLTRAVAILESSAEDDPLDSIDLLIDYARLLVPVNPVKAELLLSILETRAVRDSLLDADGEASCLLQLSFLNEVLGHVGSALDYAEWSLESVQRLLPSDHPALARYHQQLGRAYYFNNRLEEAEEHMLKAVELYRADGGSNNPTIAAQLWNLATISIEQGDNNEARERLREATEIYRNVFGDGSSEQARVSVKLAQVLQAEGKWEEAEKMMSSAVPLLTLSPECTAIDSATLFCTQAMACFDAAKYDAADSLYRLSLSIGRRVLPPHNYFLVGIEANMADDYRQLGRFEEMDSLRNEIYGEARPDEPHPRPRVAVDLISFAASYGSQKMYDESTAYYRLALKAQRSFFSQVYPYCSEKDKLKYLNRYQLIIDPVYSLALLSGNDSALSLACDMTIRGKAALIDATSRDKRLIVCSNDQRIKATAERHSVVCTRLAELLLGTADKTAERDSDVLIDSLRILRDSLESELSEYCTAFRDELAARDLGLQDVIEAIPEGTVLWEYKRYRPYDFEGIGRDAERTGAPRYLAFVINHSGDFNLIELGNASVVDSLIQQYRDEINTAGAEVYSPSGLQAEHHLNSISNELFRLLVKPLLSRSEGTRDIIISPDGMLNLIPFGVLADSDSSYMIEHFNVSYVSSGRDIVRFSQNSSLEGEAVLVADPDFDANPSDASLAQASVSGAWANSDQFETLPVMREAPPCLQGVLTRLRYSRKEAALIADILHSQSTLRVQQYQGSEASETVVKDLVIPPAILHLATHGYFCDTAGAAVDPEILVRCGLTLAGANLALEQKAARGGLDDGILTGLEITGLNLVGTRLAALSACETGVGELLSAEGVMGLRRAFQHAGAESILMSLWKVPDSETADLMVEFYRRWLGGEPKRDALRGASLEMLRRCRQERGHGYPLFWGGFILVGNPN